MQLTPMKIKRPKYIFKHLQAALLLFGPMKRFHDIELFLQPYCLKVSCTLKQILLVKKQSL